MRAKDKCPSCFQPVSPTDFLCANCELILDPSQVPERPVGEVSVVRRMLEAPQRGLPAGKPNPRPPKPPKEGMEGPTRVLNLGPELAGVPVVVATMTSKLQLSELEAWIVSLVDGLNDAGALAKKAGLRDLELRVVLRTLHEKHVIDFADEPLSDADLEMPSVMGTLDDDEEPAPAPEQAAAATPYGASSDRRDGRFVAPTSHAPVPAPPTPAPAAPAVATPGILVPPRRGPIVRAGRAVPPPPPEPPQEPAPIVQGRAEPQVLSPYPGASEAQRTGVPPSLAVGSARASLPPGFGVPAPRIVPRPPPPLAPVERTDPRIAYTGPANRKVLDALKKVKRADAAGPSAASREEKQPLADVLARDTLQVALRMEQGGRLDEAIRFLEKSIAQSPDAASLYNRLGIILMRERADYRRAETLIRKAIALAPENTVYTTNLQQVLSQQAVRSHR